MFGGSLLQQDAGVGRHEVRPDANVFLVSGGQRRQVAPEQRPNSQEVPRRRAGRSPPGSPDDEFSRVDAFPTAAVGQDPAVSHNGTRLPGFIGERVVLKNSSFIYSRDKSGSPTLFHSPEIVPVLSR